MKYDTSIPLSHHINNDGSLSLQTRERVDKSIELYQNGLTKALLMTGGQANKDAPITHAEAMKRYTLQKDVPIEDIYLEAKSLDTVGQAIFSKKEIIVPKGWGDLNIVIHDYHLERVKKIFSFIYGKEFNMNFEGIFSEFYNQPEVLKAEQKSIEAFMNTFKGVEQGNTDNILNALFERHPLYKNFK